MAKTTTEILTADWAARVAAASEGPAPGLSITISDAWGGSGGTLLAEMVAQRAGQMVWSSAVIDELAADEERLLGTLSAELRTTVATAAAGLMVEGGDTAADELARVRVILAVVMAGPAVIVSPEAHCVLSRDQALRVRVSAPLEIAVSHFGPLEGADPHAFRARLRATEDASVARLRGWFGRDLTGAADYDLCINSSTLRADTAADLIMTARDVPFPGD